MQNIVKNFHFLKTTCGKCQSKAQTKIPRILLSSIRGKYIHINDLYYQLRHQPPFGVFKGKYKVRGEYDKCWLIGGHDRNSNEARSYLLYVYVYNCM